MKRRSIHISLGLFTAIYFMLQLNGFAAVYYVDDTGGNDANNGLSPGAAWQTLSHVSLFALLPGDSVKFKRGGIWRGQLLLKNGNPSASIVYTTYGTGAKPLFLGSVNTSSSSDWIDEGGNIWRTSQTFAFDVGNIIFNYANSFGTKKWDQPSLVSQGDYWYDKNGTHVLKMYSLGNPGSIYTDIELALGQHIIYAQINSYVIFENLALKYGAANGFEIRNTHDMVIKDCDISYIGGGELAGQVRYGNAIQFWANSNNNTVKRCKIWEIYDTGVTNQNNNSGGVCQQYDLYYVSNIIWNCAYAGFEVWVDAFGTSSAMKKIYFENNTCVNIGGGWGDAARPDHFLQSGAGSAIYLGHNTALTDSLFIRNNIFYKAHCILFANNEGSQTLLETEMDYNSWYRENATDTVAVFYTTSQIDLWIGSQFANYQSTNNRDVHSIFNDPLFTSEANSDFTLTSSSPCIDAGTPTTIHYDFQFTPVPQNINYDIGAYEYIPGMQVEEMGTISDILLYPNPTNGPFQIKTNEWNQEKIQLSIYDMMGQLIMQRVVAESIISVDLSSQPNGIYQVQITQGDQQLFNEKIILQK